MDGVPVISHNLIYPRMNCNGKSDIILFEADRTCCICKDSSKHVQIHHIDGNPNNNEDDNLVVLCLDHHHETTVSGGIGRGLSPGQIRKYRDDWLEKMRARRKNASTNHLIDDGMHKALLEALDDILTFNTYAIEEYAKISADLKKRGLSIGVMDELIASICIVHNEIFYTGNSKHFERVENLSSVNWMVSKK